MCPYALMTDVYLLNIFFRFFFSFQTEAVYSYICRSEDSELHLSASPRLCTQRILIEFQQRYRSNALCQQCIKLTINKFKLHITLSLAISRGKGREEKKKRSKSMLFLRFSDLFDSRWKTFIQRLQRGCLSPAVVVGGSREKEQL